MKQGFSFSFDPPAGWRERREGSGLMYQSPDEEELIVSGSVVLGEGDEKARAEILGQMRESAIAAMKHAVDLPDVRVTRSLEQRPIASNLPCWTIEAETRDPDVLFLQAAVESQAGVLLVTLEAHHSERSRAVFEGFLDTIQAERPEA